MADVKLTLILTAVACLGISIGSSAESDVLIYRSTNFYTSVGLYSFDHEGIYAPWDLLYVPRSGTPVRTIDGQYLALNITNGSASSSVSARFTPMTIELEGVISAVESVAIGHTARVFFAVATDNNVSVGFRLGRTCRADMSFDWTYDIHSDAGYFYLWPREVSLKLNGTNISADLAGFQGDLSKTLSTNLSKTLNPGDYFLSCDETFWAYWENGRRSWYEARYQLHVNFTSLNNSPVIAAGPTSAPATPYVKQSVSFAVTASDPDGDSLTYEWDFGDGQSGSGASTSHSYQQPGSYNVSVTVRDGYGGEVQGGTSVTISNHPPVITSGPKFLPRKPKVNTSVSFSVAATDSDGDSLTYEWDFGDGQSGSGGSVTHEYVTAGSYVVTATARDAFEAETSSSIPVVVTRLNRKPLARSTRTTAQPCQSIPITLVATDRDNDAMTYRVVVVPVHGTLEGEPPNLLYRAFDSYTGNDTIRFVANDGSLDSNPGVVSIRISHKLNALQFGLPANNTVTSDYGVTRVYRLDGSVVTVPSGYVFNPVTDQEVKTHRGIDFSSRTPTGTVSPIEFSTPIAGTVVRYPNSPWKTVGVRLPDGTELQFLHASELYIDNGVSVAAGTVLGKTGSTGANAIHLHAQTKLPDGHFVDPTEIVTVGCE